MPTPAIVHPATDNNRYLVAERLRLGQAVLAPGERVREVLADNTAGSWYSLDRAVQINIAYMGRVDPQVLSCDADSPAAVEALYELVKMLARHGVFPVVVRSGQLGRRHLFARIVEPTVRAEAEAFARLHKIFRDTIRLPLSPHRLGLPVQLERPMTVEKAEHVLRSRRYRELPNKISTMIDTGVSDDPSDSERAQSAADSMFQRGWSFDAALKHLEERPGGRSLRKDGRDARAYFLSCWTKAMEYTLASPAVGGREDVVVVLSDMRAVTCTMAWPGSAGQTQKAVLLALIAIGLRLPSLVVAASERDLVEASPRSGRRPISKALKALRREGWITIEHKPTQDVHATTYRLLPARVRKTPPSTSPSADGGGVRVCGVFLTHDTFARGGGLGVSAAWVYEALTQHPQTTAELSGAAGLHPRTAGRALQRLMERDLAAAASGGWMRGPADVDEVARRRGSAGAARALVERHAAERRVFRGYDILPDGQLRFLWTAGGARPCSARTSSGGTCRAKAAGTGDLCAAHRNREPGPVAADLAWAAAFEEELADEYESVWLA